MIADLDETTIIALVAVLAGAGILALLAAWMLWLRERAPAPQVPTGGVAEARGLVASGEAAAAVAGTAPDVAATLALELTPTSMPSAPLMPTPTPEPVAVAETGVEGAKVAVSEGGSSRVELFSRSAGWAHDEGHAGVLDAVNGQPGAGGHRKAAPAEMRRTEAVRAPVQSEIVVMEGFVPPVDALEPSPVLDGTAAAPAARRRPRPAWELAEAGQTPDELLARAHELLAAGAHEDAAVQLRACARLASRMKASGIEAVARLELGDLCQASGDMTTACEHWQIARSLYGELKRATEATTVIKRMEKAGCPTDWVLTKF